MIEAQTTMQQDESVLMKNRPTMMQKNRRVRRKNSVRSQNKCCRVLATWLMGARSAQARGDSPKGVRWLCCEVTRGADLYGRFVWEKERKWERGLGSLFTMGE